QRARSTALAGRAPIGESSFIVPAQDVGLKAVTVAQVARELLAVGRVPNGAGEDGEYLVDVVLVDEAAVPTDRVVDPLHAGVAEAPVGVDAVAQARDGGASDQLRGHPPVI